VSLRYDPTGTTCSGKAQPGTVVLRDWCRRRFSVGDDGIYNCRPVRGGTQLSLHGTQLSLHAEGRAWDAGIGVKIVGDQLAAWAVVHANLASVQEVIWWDRIWSVVNPWWRPYSGADPHHGHVHIGQNWDGARHLTAAMLDGHVEPAWTYEEATVKTKLLTIDLDAGGEGWTQWDPGLGRDPIPVGLSQHGPYPPADGYWRDDEGVTFRAQPRAGSLIVSAKGQPNDSVRVFASVA
jgi:hypothetical protein